MPSYAELWDRYVTQAFPRRHANRPGVTWPGDERGTPEIWERTFSTFFENAGMADWNAALEIGPGSGKYTERVLERAPGVRVVAFDVSARFLEVCASRLSGAVRDGRLTTVLIPGQQADEMLREVERLGLRRRLDAVYSIDAMVHVDLQYLIVYLLTAALVLRPGGHLVLSLADACSNRGFQHLISNIPVKYRQQGNPQVKFEYVSRDAVASILSRLGFELESMDHWSPDGPGLGRDLFVHARLADASRAAALEGALAPAAKPEPAVAPPPVASARPARREPLRTVSSRLAGSGPPTPFFIWFLGRSGSTHLAALLNSHPEVRCLGEVFNGRGHAFADEAAAVSFLENHYRTPGPRAAGFKAKPQQLRSHPRVWQYLLDRADETRVVWLVRRNLLKQAISKQNHARIVARFGRSNLRTEDGRTSDPLGGSLRVDTRRAIGYMERARRLLAVMERDIQPFRNRLEISYEDLLADEAAVTGEVLHFLGVDGAAPLESRLCKATPDRLQDAVSNYDELKRDLAGTGFAAFLDP